MTVERDLVPVLAELWCGWTDLVTGLDEDSFAAPTRAEGWTVRDLLFHVLLDAQRALVAFAETTDERPSADRVSYWSGQRPDPVGAERHAAFVRRAAAAYDGSAGLVAQWADTARAATRAAEAADSARRVRTQGARAGGARLREHPGGRGCRALARPDGGPGGP